MPTPDERVVHWAKEEMEENTKQPMAATENSSFFMVIKRERVSRKKSNVRSNTTIDTLPANFCNIIFPVMKTNF